MAESNLIQFKRGTMAALEALMQAGTGEDGTFYLTVDDDASGSNYPSKSSRLFVGRADGSIVPVNQGIVTVTTVSELTNGINGKWHAGDYAYVTGTAAQNYADGNILAIYDGANWKQINAVGTDTYVTDFTTDASTSNGVTTVTSTVTDNFNGSSRDLDASVQFEGANGVQISSTAASYGQTTTPAKVTITGDTYSLSRTGDAQNNQAEVSLASANTNNDTSVIIKGGTNLTVSTSGTNVVELESTDFGINTVSLNAESTGGFTVSTMQNNGSSSERTSSVLDPTIVLGTNISSPVHFVSGVATLPVYTKDEIDAQKKALDAMKYRGTIGSNGTVASSFAEFANSSTLPVSIGDTFKVVGSSGLSLPAGISATGAAVDLKEGDIVIARGTEGTDGNIPYASLLFDVIPSGNEIDTTYSLTGIEHGVTLSGSTTSAADSGSFALAAGTQITLSDSSPSGITKQVTVNHASITTAPATTNAKTSATTQESGTPITLPIISDISISNGHVTGWTIQNYEVIDTSFQLTGVDTSASAANNVATVTSTVSYRDQTGSARNDVDTSFTVSSDNLNVTATNATGSTAADVKVNFVWGTFSAN